jgi:hypothetical protein
VSAWAYPGTSPHPIATGQRLATLLLYIAVMGQFAGCYQPAAHDLVGSWELKYDDSTLRLTLNPDETFDQVLEQKGKAAIQRRGMWQLMDFEWPTVVLDGALVVHDEGGTPELADGSGKWLMHVESGLGGIRLTAHEAPRLYFDKVRE